MMTKHSVFGALSLSLVLAACATEAKPTTLPAPTQEAIELANTLERCDPAFATELDAFTSGRTDVEPLPSAKCQLNEGLAAEGCGFVSWWNWAGFTDRAACVALGPPLCYATICVAGWIN
jgi:hypothetical protein